MVVIKMGNMDVFKALSSRTRIQIIKLLSKEELHITGLAKKLGISVPVTTRHVTLLEQAGLIKKRIIGNVHLLTVNLRNIEDAWSEFNDSTELEISKNETLFDALKQIPEIEFKKVKDKQFITSINGEKGYYIYEVNGKPPEESIDEFVLRKNVTISLKKIIPIEKKEINLKIHT